MKTYKVFLTDQPNWILFESTSLKRAVLTATSDAAYSSLIGGQQYTVRECEDNVPQTDYLIEQTKIVETKVLTESK